MAGKLEGKIALVTGGSTGIGFATAQRFVKEGAHVYITGRRQPELDEAVKKIGAQVTAVRADVSSLVNLDGLLAQIKREKGRLDVVFANAGGGSLAPLGSITEEQYDQTFNTNVKGLLFTVQKALPLIPDGGSIIPERFDRLYQGYGCLQRLLRYETAQPIRADATDAACGSPAIRCSLWKTKDAN